MTLPLDTAGAWPILRRSALEADTRQSQIDVEREAIVHYTFGYAGV